MKDFLYFLGLALVILSIGGCHYLYERGEAISNHTEQNNK
jgi:hypothetical protein